MHAACRETAGRHVDYSEKKCGNPDKGFLSLWMEAMEKKVDLLHEPILPALTRLAVPIVATSLVQMLYNLTDMAWIGRLGSGAVTAVGSAGMYTWFAQGFSNLAKTGGQVKTAHALGAGEEETAAAYARGALQLGILFALLFGLCSVAGAGAMIGFFGLQEAETIREAEHYLRIAGGLILFSYLNLIFTGLFTAAGDSRTPFLANVAGLLTNVVLDPVLIFGLGPVPALGSAGAAAATVLAQAFVTVLFLRSMRYEKQLFSSFRLFRRVPAAEMQEIVRIGFPAAVQTLFYSGISMIITRLVAAWGDSAVAVQRVGSQIESVSWMIGEGISASINAFIGQNYGARQMDRVKKGYHTALAMTVIWGSFTTALLFFGAEPIFRLFISEAGVVPLGIDYLKIVSASQLLMMIEMMTIGAFSGLGKTMYPNILSIVLLVARIPFACLFMALGLGLNGIWWALVLSSDIKGAILLVTFLLCIGKIARKKE